MTAVLGLNRRGNEDPLTLPIFPVELSHVFSTYPEEPISLLLSILSIKSILHKWRLN